MDESKTAERAFLDKPEKPVVRRASKTGLEKALAFVRAEKEVRKISENLMEFKETPTPSRLTSKEEFLKKINAEKDPAKRALLLKVLKGSLFR